MNSVNTMSTQIFVLRNKIYHLARFLMAESPKKAEMSYALSKVQEYADAISQGHGVVRLELPDEPSAYVSVYQGSRFTTPKPPEWAKEEDIVVVQLSGPEPVLLPRLEEACQVLQTTSPGAYDQLHIDKLLAVASAPYKYSKDDLAIIEQAVVSSVLTEVVPKPSDLIGSASEVIQWASICAKRLYEEYSRCILSGDMILEQLAVLCFYAFSPIPANQLLDLGMQPSVEAVQALESAKPGKELSPFPILGIEFYMSALESMGESRFSALLECVHFFHTQADRARDDALNQASFELFYTLLHRALLYYRCAKFIYKLILSIKHSDDMQNGYVICEEMRVRILVSLSLAAYGAPEVSGIEPLPNFTDVRQFGMWLTRLQDQDHTMSERDIHDLYSKLMYPRYIRDLALGWLFLQNNATFEKGVRKHTQVAALLEANLANNIMAGEPNYLTSLYRTLATALEQAGRQEEARSYREKGTLDYIRSREKAALESIHSQ